MATIFGDLDALDELDAYDVQQQQEVIMAELKAYEDEQKQWRQPPASSCPAAGTGTTRDPCKPTAVSAVLIARRSDLPTGTGGALLDDAQVEAILRLTHIRLDAEGIARMANLDCVSQATHLYLQRNVIERVEGLDFLLGLVSLDLSHNRIARVEGLSHLSALRCLDLSHNRVDDAVTDAVEQLPPALARLDLRSNPCCEDDDDAARVKAALASGLPALHTLNGCPVRPRAGAEPTGRVAASSSPQAREAVCGVGAETPPSAAPSVLQVTDGGLDASVVFSSEVGGIREQMLAAHRLRGEARRALIARVDGADEDLGAVGLAADDAAAENEIAELMASEHDRFNDVYVVGGGGSGGGSSSAAVAESDEVRRVSTHHKNVGSAALDSSFSTLRASVREKKAAILQRSAQRREEAAQTPSAGFAAAKKELERERATAIELRAKREAALKARQQEQQRTQQQEGDGSAAPVAVQLALT